MSTPQTPEQAAPGPIRHCAVCNLIAGTHSLNLCIAPEWCGCWCGDDDGTFPEELDQHGGVPQLIAHKAVEFIREQDAERAADKAVLEQLTKSRTDWFMTACGFSLRVGKQDTLLADALEALQRLAKGLRSAKTIFLNMEKFGIIEKAPEFGEAQSDKDLAFADSVIAAIEAAREGTQ